MAYKRKPKKKEYTVIQKIKADIDDNVIIAAIGATVKLTDREAEVLRHHIKEKE